MILFMLTQYLLLILLFVLPASHQQQLHAWESSIQFTDFGTAFQPRNQIELLGTFSNVQSLIQCTMLCNENRRCRTFDYDRSAPICRHFEGEVSTGTVLNKPSLSSSRIGGILYNTKDALEQYSSYNQTCDQCGLSINRYLQCINNTCQCPPNTYWNGQRCLNQLYSGSSCNDSSECRQDLNLTCSNQTNTCHQDCNNTFSSQTTASILSTGAAKTITTSTTSSTRTPSTATSSKTISTTTSSTTSTSATAVWSITGSMNSVRHGHTASLLENGSVLVAAGYGSSGYLNSAELCDPSTGLWSCVGSMNSSRYQHTASLLANGKLLVTGGEVSSGVYLSSAELYDPSTGVWRSAGSMTTTRYLHTASALKNGAVLVTGGQASGGSLNSTELYHPT